ncbi:oxygenase MpaB family protein [Nocardia alba]|uniref:Uncharacterized protein (DUF2236 family) n=1 Tax=Nocardia alba TaxID=225051 RepID=A0A4V2PBH6_9NOCA|nr:oxygenase MpaB family protein [Nocardia alba]TCJ97405.1 uncharacterized protein (DUF2236 family) [Nocardia alba]
MTRAARAGRPQDVSDDIARRHRYLNGVGALLGGPANVIMQLSLPPVGRGVVESVVESGSYATRPAKRGRTTLTYLAVAMIGTDEDQAAYRAAVGTAHRQVRSGPQSPVRYNAFDPQLQLWVAGCLYRGVVDTMDLLYGGMNEQDAEQMYRDAARFGTTLQMPAELWPADRAAFERYWDSMVGELSFDDEVRTYLLTYVVGLAAWSRGVRVAFGPVNRFFTTGFLPQRFRDEMGLRWSPRRQRVFEIVMRTTGRLLEVLPDAWRAKPFERYLDDMRERRSQGKSLI